MSQIFIYIFIMIVAIYLGKKKFLEVFLKNKISNLQNILIFILLFLMGIILGKNKSVIYSISTIGIQAIFMSIMIIVFSVLSVKISNILYEKISDNKKKEIK